MKYVPIVPHGAEELLEYRTERVFCFADIAAKDAAYAKWFRDCDMDILMDHPIYELQPALSVYDTLRVLDLVRPEITTIPDVHEQMGVTWKMFNEYAPLMRKAFPGTKLMGVPQGLDVDQILYQAYAMVESGLADMLAIGIKRSIPDLDRAGIVANLHERYPDLKFHLLGARWPYTNEREMAGLPWVESLDSAEPVNAAMRGVRFHLIREQFSVKRDENFQNMAGRAKAQKRLVWNNIQAMSDLLATPVEQSAKVT